MKAPCNIRFTPPTSGTVVLPPATTVACSLVHCAPPCFSRTYPCSSRTHLCNGRVAPCCHRLAFVSTPPNILFVDISNFFARIAPDLTKFHSGTLRCLLRLSVKPPLGCPLFLLRIQFTGSGARVEATQKLSPLAGRFDYRYRDRYFIFIEI